MKRDLKKRLNDLESKGTDHISRLETIDYLGDLDDYSNGDWITVDDTDPTVTVLWNRETREFRGVYCDRRSDEELIEMGANLAYL